MPFQKGHPKFGGRKLGQSNKETIIPNNELRQELVLINARLVPLFFKCWNDIKEADIKADLILKFMEFVFPKMRAHTLDVKITEEQAITVLQEAIENAGHDIPIVTESLPSGETETV